MPSLRPFHKAHFAGKELQSGKKMERAIQPEIPLPDSGTHESVREHPDAIARTGRSSRAVVQVAGSSGPSGDADGEVTLPNSRESTLRKEIRKLKRLLADKTVEVDFFRGALQKVEGSTPEERYLWRKVVYDEIQDAVARQLEHRADVSVGASKPSME
jgi:hypothetical protein